MKKLFYILIAASAVLFAACEKETGNNQAPVPSSEDPALTGRTITFSASIDMLAETRASLDGLAVQWASSGDYIGVATDNDATIRVYEVTRDAVDKTLASVAVAEVAGASEYYAVFKGSLGHSGGANEVAADDYSMISFNTTTKTFSGLTVGKQQVAENSLSSYLWYTNGYPLALAGKANGTSLSMKPCLALLKLRIDAESVPAEYYYKNIPFTTTYDIEHDHYYSAVRGFDLYQKGGSTIYSSGDYTVQVNNDGSLTTAVVDNANKRDYRQMSQSEKLKSGTDYLMCVIPGGSITSFLINFLGYADNNVGAVSWDAVYTMTKSGSVTVNPGDCYSLGTLNPLGRKKAANEAADEAADEAASIPYVPAITIDGDMSDWNDIDYSYNNSENSRIRAWKFKSDAQKIYLYLAMRKNRVDGGKNLYIGFDKDNDNATGTSHGDVTGIEASAKVIPFTNSGEGTEPVGVSGIDSASQVWGDGVGYHDAVVSTAYYDAGESLSSNSSNIYIEVSIPREYLNLPAAGNTITVGCSYGWGTTDKVSVILE